MRIDYASIIPNAIGPKLAYHGFKYDENRSYPPQGEYSFTRTYWCASQYVSIGPIQYDVETLEIGINENHDSPAEVPRSLLLIKEPDFRLWLSNRYILGVLGSDNRAVDLLPNHSVASNSEQSISAEDLKRKLIEGQTFRPGRVLPTWWEFHDEADLRRVLSEIIQTILTEGLDWFESMVADKRRHHEKLDRRRQLTKKIEP